MPLVSSHWNTDSEFHGGLMIIKSWVMILSAAVFFVMCPVLSGEGNRGDEDITGKWKLEIRDRMDRLNTFFVKEFRKDMTYTYTSTLYSRQGGVAKKSRHEGTYTFGPVDTVAPDFPAEKVKGKQLYRLIRRMNTKNFVFTRYVQFVNENTMWVWGRAPGLAGLHTRITEDGKQ